MKWETMHKLQLFQELITCAHNICFWTYNAELDLTYCNCPDETALSLIFTLEYKKENLYSAFCTEYSPVIVHNPLGMSWIADFEQDCNNPVIHVIGPVFFNDISTKALEDSLNRHNLSIPAKRAFLATLRKLPVISYTHFLEYGQMLHYCISGEKIPYSQIRFAGSSQEPAQKPRFFRIRPTRHLGCRTRNPENDRNRKPGLQKTPGQAWIIRKYRKTEQWRHHAAVQESGHRLYCSDFQSRHPRRAVPGNRLHLKRPLYPECGGQLIPEGSRSSQLFHAGRLRQKGSRLQAAKWNFPSNTTML